MAEPEARKVIAVVGMPGSGKGTFCEVAAELGWMVITFREVAVEATKKHDASNDALAIHRVADRLRKEIGPDWIAREIAGRMKSLSGKICLDDMRTPEELRFLKGAFPELKVIGISAQKEDRFDRLIRRNRWDDHVDRETLEKKDSGGGAWGIPSLLEKSDFLVENAGALEEFRSASRKILEGV
ncbi:MAG: AAA family ATPase [archaeon]